MSDITTAMYNGNWEVAISKYKELTVTPLELMEYLRTLKIEQLEDWALLGYYARSK